MSWIIRIMLAFEIAWFIALPPTWHCASDGFCSRLEYRGDGLIEDRR